MSGFDHKTFLATLTARPGVYKMLNAQGQILYVGKARHLKNRVASYFRGNLLDPKTVALLKQVHHIDVIITRSENEALLLESELIKSLRPRYNILLKDDKSYPYLFLSAHAEFPRLASHRGAQREAGEYYGPYPNAGAVYETVDLLQKLFKVRQCRDSFFRNRTRPCLQYQIKRCTAPCVGYIDSAHYQKDVQNARLFLQGKNEAVIQGLMAKMEQAAADLQFEEAAQRRDQIALLRNIQLRHALNVHDGNVDAVVLVSRAGVMGIGILSVRNDRWIGNQCYFPKVPEGITDEEALAAFLPQYYLSANRRNFLPQRILVNQALQDKEWIQSALSEQLGKKILISRPVRGQGKQWIQTALINLQHALESHLSGELLYGQALRQFQADFHLAELPQRFECFDVSHTLGEATMASCVVFDMQGPVKADYRRFHVKNVAPGDDYGAMQQVLTRHYTHLKAAGKAFPHVLIIDGGKGQLSKAEAVLDELQVSGVLLLAIAKGPTRKAGQETLFVAGHSHPMILAADSPTLHLIQRIRDEAHRFAITGHRKQRAKTRVTSRLEDIPGIGPKRRRELLRFLGGLQGVLNASVEELARTPGLSKELAERLYDSLHS